MYLSIELGIIALLVAHGADPNSRNRDGQRLLHQATKKGDREVVQQLLAYEEVSINATDRQSCTALHVASEYGCTSVAKCLLAKCGIDSNARGSYGRTAFHIAAEYGNKSITGLLLAYGAVDINSPDVNGATALCLACRCKTYSYSLTDSRRRLCRRQRGQVKLAGQLFTMRRERET